MHSGATDCRKAMEQLWDYLDGELTDARMAAVRGHLAGCSGCFSHAHFSETFLAALARCRVTDPMPRSVRDRVLACLEQAGMTM